MGHPCKVERGLDVAYLFLRNGGQQAPARLGIMRERDVRRGDVAPDLDGPADELSIMGSSTGFDPGRGELEGSWERGQGRSVEDELRF
jgi:hypothetical protein